MLLSFVDWCPRDISGSLPARCDHASRLPPIQTASSQMARLFQPRDRFHGTSHTNIQIRLLLHGNRTRGIRRGRCWSRNRLSSANLAKLRSCQRAVLHATLWLVCANSFVHSRLHRLENHRSVLLEPVYSAWRHGCKDQNLQDGNRGCYTLHFANFHQL